MFSKNKSRNIMEEELDKDKLLLLFMLLISKIKDILKKITSFIPSLLLSINYYLLEDKNWQGNHRINGASKKVR